ncbi:MAG: TIGR02147 family protein [Pseudomonadota bacterium]|nr:TIGR02147 family protein [Pseudomonadota bacterium]
MIKFIDLFSYSEYRAYLKQWIARARQDGTSNLSRISKAIGVHTSFLGHVLSGSKNLSFEQAAELSDFLKHTPIEQKYFFTLIQIERSGTQKLKKYWLEEKKAIEEERAKVKSRVGSHKELSAEDKAIFYSSWIYGAIFVATAINNGQTLEQIAEEFKLTRSKAEEFLTFLVRAGICDLNGSHYQMGQAVIYIGNDSPLVVKHHTNWRIKAIQKMDTREPTELFYSSPMSLSAEDFVKVRELLSKNIETSLEICRGSQAEEVVCLNIDFFRLAGS